MSVCFLLCLCSCTLHIIIEDRQIGVLFSYATVVIHVFQFQTGSEWLDDSGCLTRNLQQRSYHGEAQLTITQPNVPLTKTKLGQNEVERTGREQGVQREKNSITNWKTLILTDSSVRSIWTYLTASPCYTTNTNNYNNTTNRYYKPD